MKQEDLLRELRESLAEWQRRTLTHDWNVVVSLVTMEEGVWSGLEPDAAGRVARLDVNVDLPEELLDFVVVHALCRCLIHSQKGLSPEMAEERLCQRITDAILRRPHTFLVRAWFAMATYSE